MILENVQIFCINLDRSKERWEKIKNNFLDLDHNIIRFSASDKNYLKESDLPVGWESINRENKSYFAFKPGVVACALSHYRIWNFMIKNNLSYMCVVEDDAFIQEEIKNIECEDNFDILYLNDRIKSNEKNQAIDGWGTDGYILSLKGVKKLIQICEDMNAPVDCRIQSHIRGFIECNSQHRCMRFKSLRNPNIIIEGYKTLESYVIHDPNAFSYVNE